MSLLIAIPVFRVACKVGIDRGRAWSVIDELILWSITRQSRTIGGLAKEANLPPQVIVASIARLMRFRLVEVSVGNGAVAFRASAFGFKAVSSGNPLPFFPKRISRRVSFVVEWVTGDFFPTVQVRWLMSPAKIEEARQAGNEVRMVSVEGGGPSMSHEANLNRLSDIAARGLDEQVALVDGRTAIMRDDEFMVVRVVDGIPLGLPESANTELVELVRKTAALPRGAVPSPVRYSGPGDTFSRPPATCSCSFDAADLIVGGSAQAKCLEDIITNAHRRVLIHSTFLDAKKFSVLSGMVEAACGRGVTFDLLWGAEKDEETEQRNAAQAAQIAALARENPNLHRRFTVHMRTTGSHAKLILADTAEDGWIAGVGSCNWLSSPFNAVELTAVLRNQHVVADVAVAIQNLVGRRGFADAVANEMGITARDLRRAAPASGDANLTLVVGETHDRLIRAASGEAKTLFVVGSNMLGSTARPGAIMQGEAAARQGLRPVVIYTKPTGPLKNRHTRALAEEAAQNGVSLIRTRKIPLHAKFVAWDADDLVVTSLNWASASADQDFPWGDVGVHIHAPNLAADVIARLKKILPEIDPDNGAEQPA